MPTITTRVQRLLKQTERMKQQAIKNLRRTLKHIDRERRQRTADLEEATKVILKQLAELGHSGANSMAAAAMGKKRRMSRGPGRPKGSGGKRSKNAKSLVEVIKEVLGRHGNPMQVGDILSGVKGAGYKSSSANFRGILNQTLIKEKAFKNVGRGTYTLRKG
jgi:hypothetical protein